MSRLVSLTLIRDARKHLVSNMIDVATVQRTGVVVPCLVVVQRWAIPMKGVLSQRIRTRKWNLLMPSSSPGYAPDPVWGGTRVIEGDRLEVPGHGTFLVLEITDPNTYNVATSCWTVLSNASVSFSRPQVAGATVGPIDVFIQRVSDEERTQYGILYDWEVWWDASIRYPDSPLGGNLVSKDDELEWSRSPNPFPSGGNAVLDKPRYVYGVGGDPIVSAYFKEAL